MFIITLTKESSLSSLENYQLGNKCLSNPSPVFRTVLSGTQNISSPPIGAFQYKERGQRIITMRLDRIIIKCFNYLIWFISAIKYQNGERWFWIRAAWRQMKDSQIPESLMMKNTLLDHVRWLIVSWGCPFHCWAALTSGKFLFYWPEIYLPLISIHLPIFSFQLL